MRRAFFAVLLSLSAMPAVGDEPKPRDPGKLIVTYLDTMDHGLAVALRSPSGAVYLIDTGPRSARRDSGRDTIAPLLKARGIDEIAAIVLSHPHADHFGGATWLLDNFKIKRLIDSGYDARGMSNAYRDLRRHAGDRGVAYQTAVAGDRLEWGDSLEVDVLSPPREFLGIDADPARISEHGLLNGNSLVLRVRHGKNVFLFPGDAYGIGQRYMLENVKRDRLATTVLCAPHHGFNCSPEFAEATRPAIVVASCLDRYENSEVTSPGARAGEVFGKVGSKVYVTAWHGDVEVVSDGETYTVKTSRTPTEKPAANTGGLPSSDPR